MLLRFLTPNFRFHFLVVFLILSAAVRHTHHAVEGMSILNDQPGSMIHLLNRRDTVWSILATAVTPAVVVGGSSSSTTIGDGEEDLSEEERQKRQEELSQRLIERRQLMQASRSSNNRQSYLDLSRQRAALYNTTSKAWSCPPNIPCL
jgi:hypothetical protein